jgi:type VI secretion system protein ImpG
MAVSPDILEGYFREQLDALRSEARHFAEAHPSLGRELGLGDSDVADPHVELLLQSCAFLTGRLRHQADAERDRIPNALLQQLYPHLVAPVPAAGVLALDVIRSGRNFELGAALERGREFSIDVEKPDGGTATARFRTTLDTPLWPLRIEDSAIAPPDTFPCVRADDGVGAVLRISLAATGAEPLHALPLERLRLHLSAGGGAGYRVYDQLAGSLRDVVLQTDGRAEPVRLGRDCLRWCGYRSEEAALPARVGTHPGHRLLQEYFAFPEKFLFCDIDGIDLSSASERFELLFLLEGVAPAQITEAAQALRVNCVPVINLHRRALEPVRYDRGHFEYHVSADWAGHAHCEIHDIERLHAIDPDGRSHTIEPLTGGNAARRREVDRLFDLRRTRSADPRIAGTEVHLSLLDRDLRPDTRAVETLGGEALCTNRDLPGHLRAGDRLRLEGPGPVAYGRLLGRPSAHRAPLLTGPQPWHLVAQLSLNHLPLTAGHEGIARLRALLRAHCDATDETQLGQIERLQALEARPAAYYAGGDYWRGPRRGTAIDLTVDDVPGRRMSYLLFGEVLRRFLALFAHVNHLTELRLHSSRTNEACRTWPPLAGNQALL